MTSLKRELNIGLLFSNVVIIITLGLFVALFFYGYQKSGSAFFTPLSKYAIFTISGLLLFLGALFFRPVWKVNFAMIVVSTVIGLYFIEVSLSVIGQKKVFTTKGEAVLELRAKGIDAYPAVFPSLLMGSKFSVFNKSLLPLSGIATKETVFCNEGSGWIHYFSDRYGFNNDDDIYNDERRLDVALIGDSFTQGQCVNYSFSLAGLLNKRGLRTLSFGMSGNGPLIEYGTLVEYAAVLRPKIVLWIYFEGNDLENLQLEEKNLLLVRYMRGYKQDLIEYNDALMGILNDFLNKQITIMKANKAHRSLWPQVREVLVLRKLRNMFAIMTPGFSPPMSPLFQRILKKAKHDTESWGGKLYFVYLPAFTRFSAHRENDLAFHHRKDVLDVVDTLKIPLIDFSKVLAKHDDPLSLYPFRGPGHYVEEGYRLLSDKIIKKIELSDKEGEKD